MDKRTKEGLQVALDKVDTTIQELKENNCSGFLKTGNIIAYKSGDGISYNESNYIKILEANPDNRGFINISKVVVGGGDTGKWIHYDDNCFITYEEFLEITGRNRCRLADEKDMQKYIDFSKTIPYGD